MLTFCIAALLPLQTPSLETTVTYATRGAPVTQVLADISRKTGVTLEANPTTGREIVVIDLKGAKLSDFMPRLATVAAGEWKPEGKGYRLTRSDAFTRKSRAAEIERASQAFAKEVEAQKVSLKTFGPVESDQLAAKVQTLLSQRQGANDGNYFRTLPGLNQLSPTGRLATRALAALGPRALAEIQPQERHVYSTRPNRMQKPLPFDLKPILALYQREQTDYSAALLKRIDAKQLQGWYIGAGLTTVPPPPSRVLLAVSRAPFGTGVKLELLMIDGDNRIAQQGKVEIRLEDAARMDPSAAALPNDPPLELSPTSQALVGAIRTIMNGAAANPSPELLRELEQPEKYDPMSFILPDGLRAVSEGRNVVAQLEDISFLNAPMLATPEGKIGRGAFQKWLKAGHDLAETDGWLVVTPRRPWDSRETRIDRAHMGRFFRATRAAGTVGLDQAAGYALGCPRRYAECLSFAYSFLLQPQVNSAIEMDSLDFVRLYGALDARQRKALQAGIEVQASQLPVAARAEMAHLVFQADAPLQFHSSGPAREETGRPIGHEPTEAMPNGLPDDARLSGRLVAEPSVIGQVEAGGAGASAYTPLRAWDLAWNNAMNESGVHPKSAIRYAKYKYGQRGTLTMAARFSEMLGAEKRLVQSDFPPSAPWVTYNQLPEAFRAEVEKLLSQARTSVADMKKREAGNKVPPP
jgi:hypothetical protein